jgi:hypothetical protein
MDAKTQQQYAETFHGLDMKGDPLILFNAWDVALPRPSRRLRRPLRPVAGRSPPRSDTLTGKMSRWTW